MRSSSVRTGPPVRLADGASLLGDVDPDRVPGDAAPASDAARRPELVDPRRELVGHPLAVARARRAAYRAAVDVGVVDGEAGVPPLVALDVAAVEVGHVLDRRAEARGADHRAVAAR